MRKVFQVLVTFFPSFSDIFETLPLHINEFFLTFEKKILHTSVNEEKKTKCVKQSQQVRNIKENKKKGLYNR